MIKFFGLHYNVDQQTARQNCLFEKSSFQKYKYERERVIYLNQRAREQIRAEISDVWRGERGARRGSSCVTVAVSGGAQIHYFGNMIYIVCSNFIITVCTETKYMISLLNFLICNIL